MISQKVHTFSTAHAMYVERSELVVPLKTKQKDVPLKVVSNLS